MIYDIYIYTYIYIYMLRSLIDASGGKFASQLVLGYDMVEPGEAAVVRALVVVACTSLGFRV